MTAHTWGSSSSISWERTPTQATPHRGLKQITVGNPFSTRDAQQPTWSITRNDSGIGAMTHILIAEHKTICGL